MHSLENQSILIKYFDKKYITIDFVSALANNYAMIYSTKHIKKTILKRIQNVEDMEIGEEIKMRESREQKEREKSPHRIRERKKE